MSHTTPFPLLTLSSSSPPPSTSTPSLNLLPISTKRLAQSQEASKHCHYQPTIWDYKHFIKSPKNNYLCKTDSDLLEEKVKQVKVMFKEAVTPLEKLELVDVIQSLGISCLFEEYIHEILEDMCQDNAQKMKDNLHATSLRFRLLRQYGFHESQVADIFNEFRHTKGGFKESITNDIKGMLSLFEAAHLLWENEDILSEAIHFTRRKILDYKSTNDNCNADLSKQVPRSLEKPIHWRVQRSEARFFIEIYETQKDMNPLLLELAKLNFNIVQAQYKMELGNISRWWNNLGVTEKLNFARDRVVECFLSSIGFCWQPQYERCREWLTKILSFALVIDDIYDIYGSLEELELFTDAIERWDCKTIEKLPYYMKMCFLALYNTVNEMAFDVLREQQFDILPHLTKSLANSVKAMSTEAKWCRKGYMPTFVEYQHNGAVSSVGYVFLVIAFFATNQNINDGVLHAFNNNHPLLYSASLVCRLSNDLATSSAELNRGEVASSIYCYMKETNVSENDAREHIKGLIMQKWKEMNRFLFDSSPFDRSFVELVLNFARTSLFMYEYGDGLGADHSKSVEHVLSLIVNPIHIDGPTHTDSF